MTFPALDRIEALSRNLQAWQQDLAGRLSELEETSAAGTAADGLVSVTAAPDGKIISVELNPRVMRLDSVTLAEELVLAANRAQAAAAARVRDLVHEVVGGGADADEHRAGRGS